MAVAAIAAAIAGCDPGPASVGVPEAGVDAGGIFPRDGGPIDATVDAFDWPDTGPPLPPVLPAQAWEISFLTNGDAFTLTLNLDARAESGIVRAVGGAGGRASSTIFDIFSGGILRARAPIAMGLPGVHTCSYDVVSIDTWELEFGDQDGDGIHETLRSAMSIGTVTRTSPTLATSIAPEAFELVRISPDGTAPSVGLADPPPIPGVDPIVVIASEPIVPGFMPRLVGARTFALDPDVGASAPARWSVQTADLPAGHYDLVIDTEASDVAGHVATSVPTLSLDVPLRAPPAIDDVSSAVAFVASEPAPTILGDDPGEVPLVGATSLLVQGRAVIAFDSPAGRHAISMSLRYEGQEGDVTIIGWLVVRDASGAVAGESSDYQMLSPPAQVAGFAWETPTHPFTVSYVAPRAGRYYLVIEPGGPADGTCTGMSATAGIALTIDQITLM